VISSNSRASPSAPQQDGEAHRKVPQEQQTERHQPPTAPHYLSGPPVIVSVMGYVIHFANGERLRGELLDDARKCIVAARTLDRAAALFPASIWAEPVVTIYPPETDPPHGRRQRISINPPTDPIEEHQF
jgi:hypothetical protein